MTVHTLVDLTKEKPMLKNILAAIGLAVVAKAAYEPVSYTHLTLPTILLV